MHAPTPWPARPDTRHTDLPFFDNAHRQLIEGLLPWTEAQQVDERDDRAACREWVRRLGQAGWLRFCVPSINWGQIPINCPQKNSGNYLESDPNYFRQLDSRTLVLLRESLAYYSPLADFAFAMQGLGSGAISLAGTAAQRDRYLPAVASGDMIAAFALSEAQAGSDVAAMSTLATRSDDGQGFVLNGSKTWISNGGIADFYCVFAQTMPGAGSKGISAFIVDADNCGLDSSSHLQVMSPHPLATLQFNQCRLPSTALLGEWQAGFKLAMQTLDIFRASVAAAALGFARRALAEAVAHAKQRRMFGQTLADFQLTQAKLGEMATLIDAAALLTYRAAWLRDQQVRQKDGAALGGQDRLQRTVSAAMAKMTATENAQRVIDMALQMHGGLGVLVGSKVESLYRDIRSLRIYEGATEVQQLIVGKAQLQE